MQIQNTCYQYGCSRTLLAEKVNMYIDNLLSALLNTQDTELDGVAPMITNPPPTSFTTFCERKKIFITHDA